MFKSFDNIEYFSGFIISDPPNLQERLYLKQLYQPNFSQEFGTPNK